MKHLILRLAAQAVGAAFLLTASGLTVRAADLAKPLVPAVQTIQTLPDSALVTIAGKPYAVGALRAAHLARLARFQAASSLGQSFRLSAPALAEPALGARMAPASKSGPHQIPPLTSTVAAPGLPVPLDMQQFCAAAATTACLYISSAFNSQVINAVVYYVDDDVYVNDPNVCASTGGKYDTAVPMCQYFYPGEFLGDFVPTGALTYSQKCPTANVMNDPHGAIRLLVYVPPQSLIECTADVFEP